MCRPLTHMMAIRISKGVEMGECFFFRDLESLLTRKIASG